VTDLRTRLRAVPTLTGTPPAWDLSHAPDDPQTLFVDWLSLAIEQDVPERRHLRLRYRLDDENWTKELLWP
jgi:pyridoxamine 5'-phosphate oxidase